MKNTAMKIAAATIACGLSVTPVMSAELTPVGQWQSATGESRYEVTLCGDGTKLCAKLTWLRTDARTADNLQYLNKYVVQGAVATDSNKWRGTVHFSGEKVGGNVTLLNANKLRLRGCKLVMCQTVEFHRI